MDSRPLASSAVKEQITVVLSHSICGNWSWQPQEANTAPLPLQHCYNGKTQFSAFLRRKNPVFPAVCVFPASLLCDSHKTLFLPVIKWVGSSLPHNKQFSVAPVGCPRIDFNSDTIYPEILQVKGSVPQDGLPTDTYRHTLHASRKPRVSLALLTDWLQIGGSSDPLFGFS